MEKYNKVVLFLAVFAISMVFFSCASSPEDLKQYYKETESEGDDISLRIEEPALQGTSSEDEWIGRLIQNQISQNFQKFSPVEIVNRDSNVARSEIESNEGYEYDMDSITEYGSWRGANHALETQFISMGSNKYSISMTLTDISTNTYRYSTQKSFTAKYENRETVIIETVNKLCYEILDKEVGVKFTPVGKSLLNNKVDEDALQSYESLAKAEHEKEKADKRLQKMQEEQEKQAREDAIRLQEAERERIEAEFKIQQEIEQAELARIAAEEKAKEKAEKAEIRKLTQRKKQMNFAYTMGKDFGGIDIQIHFTAVNHWFLGLEGGFVFNIDEMKKFQEKKKEAEKSSTTSSSSLTSSTTKVPDVKDILSYNIAGVTGVNFSLFNKLLSPYAKMGVGYLSDNENSGLGLLGGVGFYSVIPKTVFVLFFDYSVNYLWDKYFFDKYTIGLGFDFSGVM